MAKGVSFCSTSRAKRCANFSTIFQKNYIFYLQNISVPNIFIYFVHLNYIPSIYILYIFFYLNLYTVCKKPMVQKYTSCKLITKLLCRSSRSQMFFKRCFLTNFEIFIGKHLYWILFLINLQATLLKRDSDTGVFLWILWNSKNCFFTEHLRWLLLYLRHYNTQKLSQKKHSQVKFSYNYLGSPTQADRILWRLQYSHVFFILLSCRKFEKALVTWNVLKPGLFIF